MTQHMDPIPGLAQVLAFVERARLHPVESTGAAPVTLTADVYNVDGSDTDPKHVPGNKGKTWKELLTKNNIPDTSPCYVTNAPAPADKTHPQFNVGGHVTTDPNGGVIDDSCYLMPMCSWHNNKARDRVKFTHSQSKMLKLTGYMKGELAATFQLRLPSPHPYALLYYAEDLQGWTYRDMTEVQLMTWEKGAAREPRPEVYVIVERVPGPRVTHHVRAAQLPGLPELAATGD